MRVLQLPVLLLRSHHCCHNKIDPWLRCWSLLLLFVGVVVDRTAQGAFWIPSLQALSWSVATTTTATRCCGDRVYSSSSRSRRMATTQQETGPGALQPDDTNNNKQNASFVSRYLTRLKLNDKNDSLCLSSLDTAPTIAKLRILQEAHLATIPFENLSQHGCPHPATLQDCSNGGTSATATKVLDENRGGFCFELNGLFAELLVALGYTVCRVPAFVHIDETGFRPVATHIVLVVTIPTPTPNDIGEDDPTVISTQPNAEQDSGLATSKLEQQQQQQESNSTTNMWLVDVAFGEPSLHPLAYEMDVIQETPEGMLSKLIRVPVVGKHVTENEADPGEQPDDVHLVWFRPDLHAWVPRLKWTAADAELGHHGPPLSAFQPGLDAVLDDASVFGHKVICCIVTRDCKRTVAGRRLKITGPPRFAPSRPSELFLGNNNNNSTGSDNSTDGGEANTIPTNQEQEHQHFEPPNVVVTTLESDEQVRHVLFRDFGIALIQTQGLCLNKSQCADPKIWTHM